MIMNLSNNAFTRCMNWTNSQKAYSVMHVCIAADSIRIKCSLEMEIVVVTEILSFNSWREKYKGDIIW